MIKKLIKSLVFIVVGLFSYPGLNIYNKIRISGMEHLKDLPKNNVLFVSNHQTYFADVIAFLHIFCALKWRKQNKLGFPYYLLNPFTKINFVAAEETMKSTLLSRIFTLAGALTVKRTWNEGGKEVRRGLDPSDTRKVFEALKNNWVITFPQGTTKAFAPGRKGTAHIIQNTNPIVIPVVINGFSRAFDKKGLVLKRKGTPLSVNFKAPLKIDLTKSREEIMEVIMDAIEQSKKFMPGNKYKTQDVSIKNQDLI
jgi:1-acyl-sn-glycerol-3-phosphate acyltransferase